MSVLLGAAVPYAVATAAIILLWRWIHGKHPYLLLTAIYIAFFTLWHVCNARLLICETASPQGPQQWLAAAILYVAAVGFLLANYTCIGQDTPSMTLVTLLDEAGDEGRSRDEILRGFKERGHVEERIDAMEGGGLLRKNTDGSLSATALGKLIRWTFDILFGASPRRMLILSLSAGAALCVLWIWQILAANDTATPADAAAPLAVYAAFAYAYAELYGFHRGAIRLQALRLIHRQGGSAKRDELVRMCGMETTVDHRLAQYVQRGDLVLVDGRYRLAKRRVLLITRIFRFARRVMLGSRPGTV